MELIYDAENSIKEHISLEDFQKSLHAKKLQAIQTDEPIETEISKEPETVFENEPPNKSIDRYPTFKPGIALQLLDLLREYFVSTDHPKLEGLLLSD